MKRILVVEDDLDIVDTLSLFLKNAGYEIEHIDDGAKVIDCVNRYRPDLIIMDLMLPNCDGLTCTQSIREFSNVPIVILTAKLEQAEKLKGLETGADDYLCKPFDILELLLRIKGLLDRTAGHVYFGQWTIDDKKLSATFNNIQLTFSLVEFNLFSLLFNSPDRVYSRAQIIDIAYSDFRNVTERTIDSHVRNLRKKFKDAGIEPSPIQSVYGAGYRFHRDNSVQ